MVESTNDLDATQLLYFGNTYLFRAAAKVISRFVEEDGRLAVVLSSTVFYPQGGGQPSDVGTITSGKSSFQVEDVRCKQNVVYHYGKYASESGAQLEVGNEVEMMVDEQRRILHARLHSAGHLLDVCMTAAGFGVDKLIPTKGYHFPDAPYVEYQGKVDKEDIALLIERLNEEAANFIAQGSLVFAEEMDFLTAAQKCGGSLPDYIPKDSKPRIVTIGDDDGCPCGGTHVANVNEIKSMKIIGVRVKKGSTRVAYNIEE
eukprot:CAMPEP_0196571498 /NCGR_PEP_ID=MMETSP1081-20130531/1663_1 /TAXON_ID=36882 /ORGANISM="Pyramimonas amylifera, Strain CCMP720" /LENGTH=258 /DNA_ID=CAMNT_0041888469 /DNA_START=134 /DNA_END=910 /DNA_ORIENTATION=-